MIDLATVYLMVNSFLLTIILVLAFIIIRAGSMHTFHLGEYELQNRLKWVILRTLVAMVIVGIIASLFNFLVPV
jgi:hypothetical protein